MADVVTGGPVMTADEEEALLKATAQLNNQKLVNKIKVLGMQMENMDSKEKAKYSGQFNTLSKSLGKMRKLLRKKMPANSWQWSIYYISLAILICVYAFFGYKLYKSLVERDRKREEKLKAKQSKKKK